MGALLGRTGQFCHLHSTGGSMPYIVSAHQAHVKACWPESISLMLLGLMQSTRTSAPHLSGAAEYDLRGCSPICGKVSNKPHIHGLHSIRSYPHYCSRA